MLQRPTRRIGDDDAAAADRVLRAFLRRHESTERAQAALAVPPSQRDTTRYYAAIVAPNGDVMLEWRRDSAAASRWASSAIGRGDVTGDTLVVGPLELVSGVPAITMVTPVNDTAGSR